MSADESAGELAAQIVDLNRAGAIETAEDAVAAGVNPLELMEAGAEGLREVGDKFGSGELFLPELIFAAKVFESVMEVITPALESQQSERTYLGRFLLGTVQEDVHDIGQTIVGSLAGAAGFEVVNLGVNVPTATFVEKVQELKPDILGLSALLTTTMEGQRSVIRALKEAGLREQLKVIIGGAPTTEEWAREIGADAYAADAATGVTKMRALVASHSVAA
jgi:trimethylamine corrinoid protein